MVNPQVPREAKFLVLRFSLAYICPTVRLPSDGLRPLDMMQCGHCRGRFGGWLPVRRSGDHRLRCSVTGSPSSMIHFKACSVWLVILPVCEGVAAIGCDAVRPLPRPVWWMAPCPTVWRPSVTMQCDGFPVKAGWVVLLSDGLATCPLVW